MSRFFTIAIAAWIIACTPAQTTPQVSGPDPNAPAHEQLVALFEQLASQLDAVRSDCEQVASVLNTWTDANRERYPGMSEQATQAQLSSDDRLRHEDQVRTAMIAIVDISASCRANPGAQAAFTSFDVLVDPQ